MPAPPLVRRCIGDGDDADGRSVWLAFVFP